MTTAMMTVMTRSPALLFCLMALLASVNAKDLTWDLAAQGIDEYTTLDRAGGIVVIEDQTQNHFLHEELGGAAEALVESLSSSDFVDREFAKLFVAENRASVLLRKISFPKELKHEFVTKETVSSLFKELSHEEDWERFLAAYPKGKGVVSISKPVFSREGDKALLSIKYRYGPVGSIRGNFLFFRRIGQVWSCTRLFDAPSSSR